MPTQFDLKVLSVEDYVEVTGSDSSTVKKHHRHSQMFLQLTASPDFVSHLPSLMTQTPIVRFELVLDPLIFGVLPRSIVPTVLLIGVTAMLGYSLVCPVILRLIEEITRGQRQKMVRIKT